MERTSGHGDAERPPPAGLAAQADGAAVNEVAPGALEERRGPTPGERERATASREAIGSPRPRRDAESPPRKSPEEAVGRYTALASTRRARPAGVAEPIATQLEPLLGEPARAAREEARVQEARLEPLRDAGEVALRRSHEDDLRERCRLERAAQADHVGGGERGDGAPRGGRGPRRRRRGEREGVAGVQVLAGAGGAPVRDGLERAALRRRPCRVSANACPTERPSRAPASR